MHVSFLAFPLLGPDPPSGTHVWGLGPSNLTWTLLFFSSCFFKMFFFAGVVFLVYCLSLYITYDI